MRVAWRNAGSGCILCAALWVSSACAATHRIPRDVWAVEMQTLAAAYEGRSMVVEGQLVVNGNQIRFFSLSTPQSVDVVLTADCELHSVPGSVALLRKLIERSQPTFGSHHLSVLSLRPLRAWVSARGRVEVLPVDRRETSVGIGAQPTHQFVVEALLAARSMGPSEHWH